MALPKSKRPLLDVTLPSTKKVVKIRQISVMEEKILLLARQSGETADFFKAIAQIISNCLVDSKTDVMKMALCDSEYLFTKIRSFSISNISKVIYQDNEDEQNYSFDIDLDKVSVKFPDDVSTTIKVDDDLSFTMKYPPLEVYSDKEFFALSDDKVFDHLVVSCFDKVFEGEKVHLGSDQTKEEILEFVNGLPAAKYADLRKFFSNVPSLYHEIKYKNSKGTERSIILRTIDDFFTFG